MKFIKEIIYKIKLLFSRKSESKLIAETNTSNSIPENSTNLSTSDNSQVMFSGFKVDKEVLELAIKFEKKKKEIESKKQELYMLNSEIQYLENNLNKMSKK